MKAGWRNILGLFLNFVLTFGYDNLSVFKKATQSSRNNDNNTSPARAVDRDITTCSSTGADNPAWWYVDLEEIKSIHDIKINFKGADIADQQGQRELMYGYQLYVSNTTDLNSLDSMHHCYNHSGHTLPNLTSTHVCTTFGRYVIFYNERIPGMTFLYSNGMIKNFTHVQLCEMDVKGCPEGYYGLECRGICSNNCQENGTCNHVTGDCDNGCSDGWTGERCNKTCGPGRYGQNCSYVCSRNCKDAKCDPVHGKCRCKQGWRGSDCSTECSNGTFGENCLQNCSGHCRNNEVCNNTNGECPNGCNSNYEDVTCHKMTRYLEKDLSFCSKMLYLNFLWPNEDPLIFDVKRSKDMVLKSYILHAISVCKDFNSGRYLNKILSFCNDIYITCIIPFGPSRPS